MTGSDRPGRRDAAVIRLATPADAGAIARLSRTEIEHGLSWRWTPPRVRAAIADPATNVAVAVDAEALRGFGIMVYRERRAHLCLLAVAPACQGQGLGGALLGWLERVARVAGIEQVGLEVRHDNRRAIAFYERHGFRRAMVVVGMYQGREDGLCMDKALP